MFKPTQKKILVPVAAFLSGAVVGVTGLRAVQQRHVVRRPVVAAALWGADDIEGDFFKSFQKQREEMNGFFKSVLGRQAGRFGNATPGADFADMDLRDNGDEYVYRIPLNGVNNKKVDVRVDRGMVTVTAQSKDSKKLEKGDASETTESMSEFQKTFPLVAGANPAKMDFKVENDSIVIRFPKLKGV